MKDYQKLFAVRENNLTAEEIAGAETLVLFLCKGCIPALPKMNAPEYLVKAVDELLKKNEKLADTGEITPVGVGTTYVIVSIANDPLTTGLVKVEVRPSDLTVGKTSVAYPQVAAGTDFTVALKADGTVWTWGQNTYGQLGNGNKKDKYVPAKVIKS